MINFALPPFSFPSPSLLVSPAQPKIKSICKVLSLIQLFSIGEETNGKCYFTKASRCTNTGKQSVSQEREKDLSLRFLVHVLPVTQSHALRRAVFALVSLHTFLSSQGKSISPSNSGNSDV